MIKDYEFYMRKCIELAKNGEGSVSPNPLVGAVVLDRNNEVAGMGWHEKYGEAHAEVNAFNNAQQNGTDVSGGTIFVSLEPCSHYGKTPPCADLIIEKNIKKAVIGCVDPNPKVDKGGIRKLKAAGIEVITGVLEDECKRLNEIFMKNQIKKMPFVSIKTATTLDGKIATKTGSSKWITSEKARAYVQKLRNKYDAILTGSGTVISDNPSLTCRMEGKNNGRNPVRVVIDSTLKTSPDSKVYNDDGTKVFVACADFVSLKEYGDNVEFIKCPLKSDTGKIDLKYLCDRLFEKGVMSILVEAGGQLNGAFLRDSLADKLYQFTAAKILGDNEAKSFVDGYDIKDINDCVKLSVVSCFALEPDLLIECDIHSI